MYSSTPLYCRPHAERAHPSPPPRHSAPLPSKSLAAGGPTQAGFGKVGVTPLKTVDSRVESSTWSLVMLRTQCVGTPPPHWWGWGSDPSVLQSRFLINKICRVFGGLQRCGQSAPCSAGQVMEHCQWDWFGVDTYVLPSRIPSLCTRSTRAGIEWCCCHRAVCMVWPS